MTPEPTPPREPGPSASWQFGQVLQGLAMGGLLFFAVLQLIALAADATPFAYQGY